MPVASAVVTSTPPALSPNEGGDIAVESVTVKLPYGIELDAFTLVGVGIAAIGMIYGAFHHAYKALDRLLTSSTDIFNFVCKKLEDTSIRFYDVLKYVLGSFRVYVSLGNQAIATEAGPSAPTAAPQQGEP